MFDYVPFPVFSMFINSTKFFERNINKIYWSWFKTDFFFLSNDLFHYRNVSRWVAACLMHIWNTKTFDGVVYFNVDVYYGIVCFQFRPGCRPSRRRFSWFSTVLIRIFWESALIWPLSFPLKSFPIYFYSSYWAAELIMRCWKLCQAYRKKIGRNK